MIGDSGLHARVWQQVGGIAAVLAILISLVHISRHLRYNTSREIKRCTLRILLLVPFYALDCFLSLVFNNSRFALPYLLTAFREFYEAVVLSAFMQLVLTFLGRRRDGSMGGPQAVGEAFCTAMRKPSHASMNSRLAFVPVIYSPGALAYHERRRVHHKRLHPRGRDGGRRTTTTAWTASFVSGVLIGILQYAVVMVVVLVADVSIWLRWGAMVNDLCGAGGLCVWKIPFYMKAVSCGFAMYNLTLFYFEAKMCKELKERLDLIHPHNKFFSVKMIIFFTFFQKLIVGTVLRDWFHVFDVLEGGPEQWTANTIAEGFQTFLLCVEMLLFAVWHMQAYPVDEFNKLDAATSLQAAISKRSRLDLKSAVQEAVDAGLAADPDPSDKHAVEWRALLREARALLDQLYPEVAFEGQSSDFVLRTSQAATVHITVDAQRGRLSVTSFTGGGIEVAEPDDIKVTLTEDLSAALAAGAQSPLKKSATRFMRQNNVTTVREDLAGIVHNLCSPSGEVGFLGTCTMYKDILLLRGVARDQRRAVRLLRRRAGKQPSSEADIVRAFRAFDRNGTNAISRQDFLHVFVSAADGDDAEAEANLLLDSMGLQATTELSYDAFKSFLLSTGTSSRSFEPSHEGTGSSGSEALRAPLLEGGSAA